MQFKKLLSIHLLLLSFFLGFKPAEAQGASSWKVNLATAKRFVSQKYSPARVEVIDQWEKLFNTLKTLSEEEKLQYVNRFFHAHIRYRLDQDLHRQEDYWTTPFETLALGQGDCEDYAIGKYMTLLLAGVDPDKLRLIYVRARIGQKTQAHMVLGYYATPTSQPLILDSLVKSIQPAGQRKDLQPVFSFNVDGLWAGQGNQKSKNKPQTRLSRWGNVLTRMTQQGIYQEK